jgi:hypothetical protein
MKRTALGVRLVKHRDVQFGQEAAGSLNALVGREFDVDASDDDEVMVLNIL